MSGSSPDADAVTRSIGTGDPGFSWCAASTRVLTRSISFLFVGPSWLPPELARLFSVRRQVLYWFDAADRSELFDPARCPVFIWELPVEDRVIYGFPAVDGPTAGVRIATEQQGVATNPQDVDRRVAPVEAETMHRECVAPFMPELRAAAYDTLRQLKRGDRVALFAFAEDVDRLTDLTTDRRRVAEAIARISPGGGTNIIDAINMATK